MLPVAHQWIGNKHNLPEGRRRQRQKPVVHVHFRRVAMLKGQAAQRGVHHQGAAGDIVLHQQPGKSSGGRIPALAAEEALRQGRAVPVNQAAIAVYQQGRIRAIAGFGLNHGLPAAGQAAGIPFVVLVAQGNQFPVRLAQKAPEIADSPQAMSIFLRQVKAFVLPRDFTQQGRRAVRGAVVLHQHGKAGIILLPQGGQLPGKIRPAVITGQQYLHTLHHAIPHFKKNLMMELICRRLPRRVRVFSRAQEWVRHISG